MNTEQAKQLIDLTRVGFEVICFALGYIAVMVTAVRFKD